MKWLLALIEGLFSGWLGHKTSDAERLGKSEEQSCNDAETIKVLNKEAEAKANAPTKMSQLIEEQRKGRV
jgi:hypothetical protein